MLTEIILEGTILWSYAVLSVFNKTIEKFLRFEKLIGSVKLHALAK